MIIRMKEKNRINKYVDFIFRNVYNINKERTRRAL